MTSDTARVSPFRCTNHPDTETHLRCSRCGKPICVRCVIQTPVGGRCRECADLKKPPMFQVGPRRFAKAAIAGVIAASLGGFIWAQSGFLRGLSSILLLLMGYVVGEAVSRGAGRRVSRELVLLAGALTVLGALVGRGLSVWIRLPSAVPVDVRIGAALNFAIGDLLGNLFGLLFLVLAVVIATSRVR